MNTAAPALRAPAGACDTHMHFFDDKVPSAPGAPSLPGHFTVPMYEALQRRLGLARVVVVQPNAYRHDHRVLVESLRALGAKAKGVAAVAPDVSDAEIERLTRAGIVGQRIFNLPNGAVGFDRMDAVMARVHPFGWYANIQLDGRELPRYEAQILRLPGKFVIDHVGKFLEPVTTDDASFKTLLRLMDTGRCWVKLAGVYEFSKVGAPKYDDVGRLAKALVAHAPERILWASNWPHSGVPAAQRPDDGDLLDLLLDWAPDDAMRAKILVDNPAGFYGFA